MLLVKPSIKFFTPINEEDIMRQIEKVARVCYKSEEKISAGSAEKLIRNILKRGHEAMIEFATIGVKIVCDRGVSHEIVRHRLSSYAQESTRYCNYQMNKFDSQIKVIDLATGFNYNLNDEMDAAKYAVWTKAMENAEKSYMEMIELGATPQEARSVLPNSTKTEINVMMNLREWRHFLRLRTAKDAHPQMREVANMIKKEFKEKLPVIFEDIE